MPSHRQRFFHVALITLVALAGCGSEEEPAVESAAETIIDERSSFAEIPRQRLYGASRVETLWSPAYELEVIDLPPGWDGARIAILSDFHLGLWEENETIAAAAVQRAVDSGADIVALIGDYIDSTDDAAALREVLAPLRGRRAVAVLGDRDVRSDSLAARISAVLQESGVALLRNTSAAIELGGDTAWIAGLDAEVLQSGFGDQQYIVATLGPTGRTPLLLTHIPGLATRAAEGQFAVTISGNTFCGDIEIPTAPRLTWLANEVFPAGGVEGIERLFRVQGGTVLVTCGLGYGFVPIKFGAAPEVPILTLRLLGATPTADAEENDGGVVADSLIRSFEGGRQPDSL